MEILIDSSIWIDAINKKEKALSEEIRRLESENLIVTAKPIQFEISQGAKTDVLFRTYWNAFKGFRFLRLENDHWHVAAKYYYACRKRGITPATVDCLIATLAKSYDVPIWTKDIDFKHMQPILGFALYDIGS